MKDNCGAHLRPTQGNIFDDRKWALTKDVGGDCGGGSDGGEVEGKCDA